ncbi:MAG: alternative ribosome rescue aminoacyl-tRNA hydrolase ArfB [Termitinemataceae bacterium]|nr:MAG: alternative ribosome rescue aminoacyl-tRNA hydrolase ArfB [Termitinemataceae bacterium]
MNVELVKQTILSAAQISASRSGGPGGQNVNKVNTKIILKLNINDLGGLSEAEFVRLRETLRNRITAAEEIVISSSEERTARTNMDRAFARLTAMIIASAKLPKQRRPTKPSKSAIEKRLKLKHKQSLKKLERNTQYE